MVDAADVSEATLNGADTIGALDLKWKQDLPEPVVSAVYNVWQLPTGAADETSGLATQVCTDVAVPPAAMDGARYANGVDGAAGVQITGLAIVSSGDIDTGTAVTLARGRCVRQRVCSSGGFQPPHQRYVQIAGLSCGPPVRHSSVPAVPGSCCWACCCGAPVAAGTSCSGQ